MIRALAISAALAMLAGCGATAEEPKADKAPAVEWSNYPDGAKAIAAENYQAKDCTAMQEMFDTFDKRGDASDLMALLDWQMERAGCYSD